MDTRKLTASIAITIILLFFSGCKNGGGGGSVNTDSCEKGTYYLSLKQNGNTYIYNETAPDPLLACPTKHASVTKVTNSSGYNMTLAHGVGSQFIILDKGNSTDSFNRSSVEGNWSAQYSGEMSSAPAALSIQIDWARP